MTIGTNTLQFGGTGYKNSPFFVGNNTDDGVTANKFSIGNKLYYDGTTLTIAGTVVIDGTSATTVVANAGDPAAKINTGSTKIDGGKITANSISATEIRSDYVYAGTINADNITSGTMSGRAISGGTITGTTITGTTITGGTIQNAASSQTFMVTSSGNVFANNIYATGTAGANDRRFNYSF